MRPRSSSRFRTNSISKPPFLSCSTPSARFSKSTNTAVVSSSRRIGSVIRVTLHFAQHGREGFRERRDERGPCGGADVLLIHLELDAGVRALGMHAAQVGDERVRHSKVRIIAPYADLGRARTQRVVPEVHEPALVTAARIVQEPDVAVAHF